MKGEVYLGQRVRIDESGTPWHDKVGVVKKLFHDGLCYVYIGESGLGNVSFRAKDDFRLFPVDDETPLRLEALAYCNKELNR